MDMQAHIDAVIASERQKTLSTSDQLTLGEMILKMEHIVEKQKVKIADGKEEATVQYTFEYFFPTSADSWRGSYSELALNIETYNREGGEDAPKQMKATAFLELLKSCLGKEFTGYKGGEYTMSKHTPVWVANEGNSGNTGVVEVVDEEYVIYLVTGYCEY